LDFIAISSGVRDASTWEARGRGRCLARSQPSPFSPRRCRCRVLNREPSMSQRNVDSLLCRAPCLSKIQGSRSRYFFEKSTLFFHCADADESSAASSAGREEPQRAAAAVQPPHTDQKARLSGTANGLGRAPRATSPSACCADRRPAAPGSRSGRRAGGTPANRFAGSPCWLPSPAS